MSQVQVIDQTLAAQISRIEQAIVAAETHAQLSQVIALADAAIAYAKSLGKAYDEQRQRALSAKVDAEDRLGRILLATPKAKGSRGQLAGRDFSGGTKVEPPENRAFSGGSGAEQVSTPTLKALGIDKKTAARAQAIASLPEDLKQAVKNGDISVAKAIAKPKKVEAIKPSRDEKLAARGVDLDAEVERLGAALAQAEDAAEQAVETAANLQAVADGDEAKRLGLLTLKLRNAESQKHALMNENAALKRQIKAMQRQQARAA